MSDSLEFNVELSSYTGSLEILLDLAKAQKVDLEKISVTKLGPGVVKSSAGIALDECSNR